MTYPVTIDVPSGDDWETLWSGAWRVPPQIGMTFELRGNPGGPAGWFRVAALNVVLFEDEDFTSSCTVYAQMIDIDDVAPKGD